MQELWEELSEVWFRRTEGLNIGFVGGLHKKYKRDRWLQGTGGLKRCAMSVE